MQDARERQEMCTEFWSGNLKGIYHVEGVGVYGMICKSQRSMMGNCELDSSGSG
jgi:hypothetical protein